MENLIKQALNTTLFKKTGCGGGGCISEGDCYQTDNGLVFVKRNAKVQARHMFDGEYESLLALDKCGIVKVPKPIVVLDNPKGGAVIVMEYLDKLSGLRKYQSELGTQLARLHLHNGELLKKRESSSIHTEEVSPVSQFGFHIETCCGIIPQDNTWSDDWVSFYTTRKLKFQIDMVQKKHANRDLESLWSKLQIKIPEYFKDITVTPALLHGDLWSGNAMETPDGPVIIDPATFYGHSEFDLAIAVIFGGFSDSFFSAYHKLIPKEPGFDERHELYQLFHYLNHWNHFGGGYKQSSLSIMQRLTKS